MVRSQDGVDTISYGDLARAASYPRHTRRLGPYLLEIAEWCERRGRPPLNALAVPEDGSARAATTSRATSR